MRNLELKCFAALLSVAHCAVAADQSDLLCRPTDDPDDWIESIHISPSQGKAWLRIKSHSADQELPLLYFTPDDTDQPIYAFNAPVAGTNVVNAFKLFRVAEQWRLISAAMEDRTGALVLSALRSSIKLACRRIAPNNSFERTRER
jgi:hypothetical protein